MSSSLDNEQISENLYTDREYFQYGRPPAFNGRKVDVGTECLGMSFGLASRKIDESWFGYAVRAPVINDCNSLLSRLAANIGVNNNEETSRSFQLQDIPYFDYFRYWHGYAAISRPALSVLPYRDFRMLVFNGMLVLFFLLGRRLYRDFGAGFAFAFFLPFLIINYAGFLTLWTKAVSWIVALVGALIVSDNASKQRQTELPLLAFFMLGAATAYFDWLTVPLFMLMFPALVFFLYRFRFGLTTKPLQQFIQFATINAFWVLGYTSFFASKFLLAVFVMGPGSFETIRRTISYRIRGAYESVSPWPGAGISENFEAFKTFWGIIVVVCFIIAPLAKAERRQKLWTIARENPAFLLIAISPFVWWEVLSNHSQIHAIFTHALLVLFLIPMSLTLFNQWPTPQIDTNRSEV